VTTVFFDRTCGKKLPQALRLLGLDIEAHHEHFADDEQDDVWLTEVGRRGWVVVTNDKRIRFNESEQRAVVTHGVGCFVFTSGNLKRWDMMRILARAWDRMQQAIAETPRPFIYSIHANASVEPLYPKPAP
jgi:PIN like domain